MCAGCSHDIFTTSRDPMICSSHVAIAAPRTVALIPSLAFVGGFASITGEPPRPQGVVLAVATSSTRPTDYRCM